MQLVKEDQAPIHAKGLEQEYLLYEVGDEFDVGKDTLILLYY